MEKQLQTVYNLSNEQMERIQKAVADAVDTLILEDETFSDFRDNQNLVFDIRYLIYPQVPIFVRGESNVTDTETNGNVGE